MVYCCLPQENVLWSRCIWLGKTHISYSMHYIDSVFPNSCGIIKLNYLCNEYDYSKYEQEFSALCSWHWKDYNGVAEFEYLCNITCTWSLQCLCHSCSVTFSVNLFPEISDSCLFVWIPYFPAHKTHFFPRKMWPNFDLRLMCRG